MQGLREQSEWPRPSALRAQLTPSGPAGPGCPSLIPHRGPGTRSANGTCHHRDKEAQGQPNLLPPWGRGSLTPNPCRCQGRRSNQKSEHLPGRHHAAREDVQLWERRRSHGCRTGALCLPGPPTAWARSLPEHQEHILSFCGGAPCEPAALCLRVVPSYCLCAATKSLLCMNGSCENGF